MILFSSSQRLFYRCRNFKSWGKGLETGFEGWLVGRVKGKIGGERHLAFLTYSRGMADLRVIWDKE